MKRKYDRMCVHKKQKALIDNDNISNTSNTKYLRNYSPYDDMFELNQNTKTKIMKMCSFQRLRNT